jgi:hypothetical protein
MPTVSELTSKNIGNAISNVKTWVDILINPKTAGYGAKGDGIKDDFDALQSAATDASGGVLWIPEGDYFISSPLNLPADTTVFAYGARIFNTTSHQYLINLESGIKIYGLELEGAGNATADSLGRGMNIVGADSANYKSDITLTDCYIHNMGFYGVYLNYVENVVIESTKIQNVGYAGVMGISVTNVKVDKCHVKGISPGSTNAYGVAFTRTGGSDLVANPRSKDCIVTNSLIEDNALWEGLNTHAGENISFVNNTIRNCKVGISIVASHLSGTDDYGSQKCTAIGNKIYGIAQGHGIVVAGASGGVGATIEYAKNCVIQGNTLVECGEQGNSVAGAIHILDTEACIISGNTLKDCYSIGINLYHDNQGFSVSGNAVVDVQDSSVTTASGITIRSSYNVGTISGNTLLRVNDTLNTYVAERGIYVSNTTGVDITVGPNHNNYVIEMNGVQGQVAKFNSLGNNVGLFTGIGSPETVITAAVGSLYINKNGGAGTTLYIKETGSGNTGWVGK